MAETEEMKRMVMTFRVTELSSLLAYAGKNKIGRKQELQARSLDLAKSRSTAVHMKIRELYQGIQSQSGVAPSEESPTPAERQSGYIATPAYPQSVLQGRSAYSANYKSDFSKSTASGAAPVVSKYPTHPDVCFKELPFYDVLAELVKPTCLAPSQVPGKSYNDAQFMFHLSPQQSDQVGGNRDTRAAVKIEFPVQLQMRLCLMETSCPQGDHFPPNISVRVNNKTCQLPNPIPSTKQGVEPRRPPKPVNITPLCRISPLVGNSVHVTWSTELGRAYCVTVLLVRRLSSQDLLSRLKTRGVKNADFTRALIKEKLSEGCEDEIATTSLKCSLQCPLGKCRMQLPCRAVTCTHLQCFDAGLYVQMNERKPTWVCPVCDKPCLYDKLVIDGYFTEMLQCTGAACMDVRLEKDGSWVELSKAPPEVKQKFEATSSNDVSVETLEDDSGSDEVKVTSEKVSALSGKSATSKPSEPECVDLTSDCEDEPAPPLKKRVGSGGSVHSASGKWQATPVGETRLKLSFSTGAAQGVADSTAPVAQPTFSPLQSMSALAGISAAPTLSSIGGGAFYSAAGQQAAAAAAIDASMPYLGLMSGSFQPSAAAAAPNLWSSYGPGGAVFSPPPRASAYSVLATRPPPAGSPDVIDISLD